MVPLAGALALALAACGGGRESATPPGAEKAPAQIKLSTPAFTDGGRIPRELSCDGAGRSPELAWTGVPSGARELVLAVEDPDAPGGTFVHWTAFGISPSASGLPAGGRLPSGVKEGRNSAGDDGWAPPCPPEGDKPHHYVFTVYALRAPSGLKQGADAKAVRGALSSGALARGSVTGVYGR